MTIQVEIFSFLADFFNHKEFNFGAEKFLTIVGDQGREVIEGYMKLKSLS